MRTRKFSLRYEKKWHTNNLGSRYIFLTFYFATGVRAAWERVKSDARAAATERTSGGRGRQLHPGNGESWAASSGANPKTDPGRGKGKVIIYCLHICKVSVLLLLLKQVQTETIILASLDFLGKGLGWRV